MKLFCIELFSWPFFAVILSNMLWCKILIWSLPNTLRTIGGLYWLRCLFQLIEIYILFTLNGRCVFYVNTGSYYSEAPGNTLGILWKGRGAVMNWQNKCLLCNCCLVTLYVIDVVYWRILNSNSSCMIPCRFAKGDMTTLKRYSPPLPTSNAISLQSRLLLLYDRASITWAKFGSPIAEQDDDPGYTRGFEVQIVHLITSVGLKVENVCWIPILT